MWQRVEQECLSVLSKLKTAGNSRPGDELGYAVRTPRALYFDAQSSTQVQEYLPGGIDLKHYVLATYPPHTPESCRAQCRALGKAIGHWLREFHNLSLSSTEQGQSRSLRAVVGDNSELQRLKHTINFEWLQAKPDQFPKVLGDDAKEVFAKVRDMAAQELQDSTRLNVIHGDFWTGK